MKKTIVLFFSLLVLFACSPLLAAGTGTVKGSYVNVRKTNAFSGEVVGKKLRGETYEILFEEAGWRKIRFPDGMSGWIFLGRKDGEPSDGNEEPDVDAIGRLGMGGDTGVATLTSLGSLEDEYKSPSSFQVAAATDPDKDKKDIKPKGKGKGKTSKDKKPVGTSFGLATAPSRILSSSKTAEEWYNEGIEKFEQKKYPEALECNQEALKLAPGNAEILNNLGNCLFKLGRVDEALKQWKEALSIAPRSAKICNNMGIAYYQKEDNEKAIDYYKKAVLFEPQFPDPYYNLGSVYGFKGKYKEALDNYRKYLEFSPDPTMKSLTEERIDYCQKQLGAKKAPAPAKK